MIRPAPIPRAITEPRMARLFDSVPPDVKKTSSGSAPKAAATTARLSSTRALPSCPAHVRKMRCRNSEAPHHNLHHLGARFGCGSIIQVGFAIGTLFPLVYRAVLRFTAHRVPAFRAASTSANASGGVCARAVTTFYDLDGVTRRNNATMQHHAENALAGKMQSPAKW